MLGSFSFGFDFNCAWEVHKDGWVQATAPKPTPASEARLAYALHRTRIWDTQTGGFVNRAVSAINGEHCGKVVEVTGETISVKKVVNQKMLN